MLRPPIPPYAEIVTHLESYAERYKLDTLATSPMVLYGQKHNKNKKNQGSSIIQFQRMRVHSRQPIWIQALQLSIPRIVKQSKLKQQKQR